MPTNTTRNFKIKKRSFIFMGFGFIFGSTLVQYLLNSFNTDESPIAFLSINNIEFLIGVIIFIFVLFSFIIIYLNNRKIWKKQRQKVWNRDSLKSVIQASFLILLFCFGLYKINVYGYSNWFASSFLFFYGLLFVLLNYHRKKTPWLFWVLSSITALFCYNFLTYWYFFFIFLGICQILIGTIKNEEY